MTIRVQTAKDLDCLGWSQGPLEQGETLTASHGSSEPIQAFLDHGSEFVADSDFPEKEGPIGTKSKGRHKPWRVALTSAQVLQSFLLS